MTCTFLTQDIVCNRSVKGIEPIAYILPFEGLNVVVDDVTGEAKLVYNTNQSTFSTIQATKFALNAGSSVVSSEVKENGFKHTFTAILAQVANGDLDKMDGVVVIVKYLSGGYAILGSENGLYKTAQSRMVNEESGLVTVTYETREGMEEMLSERILNVQNIDGSIFVNMEAITGLYIHDSESIAMATDSTKKCMYYNTVSGDTINSTSGVISATPDATGRAVLLFEKNALVSVAGSDFGGVFKTITTGPVSIEYASYIASLSAKNSKSIDAEGAGLTAASIATLLSELVSVGNVDGTLILIGGTNAAIGTWSAQAVTDKNTLVTRGWTVTYNS
jgi:hypothetical protein